MSFDRLTSIRRRQVLGVLMAAVALLFMAALLYASLQQRPRPWPTSPRHGIAFLVPIFVYVACRYARADIVVKLVAIALLAIAAQLAFDPHGLPDPLLWAKVAGVGLCGVGLLFGVRWVSFFWYVVAAGFLIDWVDLIRMSHIDSWLHNMLGDVLATGLVTVLFCVGGSAAVASDAKTISSGRWSSVLGGPRVSRGLAVVSAVTALFVVTHWFATRIPDPQGIDQLHPRIKSEPMLKRWSAHTEPHCNKITYCGPYVEVSCRPETDGPVKYYDNSTGSQIVSCSFWGVECGKGPLSRQATNCPACPPAEWTSCIASRGEIRR